MRCGGKGRPAMGLRLTVREYTMSVNFPRLEEYNELSGLGGHRYGLQMHQLRGHFTEEEKAESLGIFAGITELQKAATHLDKIITLLHSRHSITRDGNDLILIKHLDALMLDKCREVERLGARIDEMTVAANLRRINERLEQLGLDAAVGEAMVSA